MSESGSGSNNGSDEYEELIMFECRHCPGSSFTAAEKDLHRAHHKRRRGVPRGADSTITMFEPIMAGNRPIKKTPPNKNQGRKKQRKVAAKKSYNHDVGNANRGKKHPGA